MTRVFGGATPPGNMGLETSSQRSGNHMMFSHQLGTKISRSIVKPKRMIGEEDRVCLDLIKCCSMMEGKWNVTAHATLNGAAQSILQTSLDVLRKPEAWQSWWNSLTESAKGLEEIAHRLYLENSSERMSDYDNDPMHPVGTSRLHERTQTMLHVWQSPESAKLFAQGWTRAWQALLEHRIEGIFVPFTVLFCIEGRYVSVTALPPLLVKESPPVLLPGSQAANSSLITTSIEHLMQALKLPEDVKGLVVAPGFDGRHYVVSLKELIVRRLPPPFEDSVIRTEALHLCMRENALSQSDKYVLRTLVPAAVEDLAKAILRRRQDDRSIADLTKDGLLRMVLHSNGVNMTLLHHVSLCAQHRFLETQENAYRTIIDLSYTEMVGRVLKQFVRVDMMYHANEGRDSHEDRLDVVNRFAHLFVSKDVPFWLDFVLPAVRHKFKAPDTFELSHDQVHIPTVLRICSARVGVEYVQQLQRFDKFTFISGMWLLCCKAPDWLATESPRTAEQIKEQVMSLWKETEPIENPKMKRVFRARAFLSSVMLNTATLVAKEEFDKLTQFAETQGATMETRIEDIRLTSLMLDMRMEPAEKRKLVERYVKKVSKFPSGNFGLDGALITAKYIQAVNTLKALGDVPPLELIEAALRQFDSIPGMNFPFSVVHAQALVAAEQALPGIPENMVPIYHKVVAEAKRIIGELHGPVQLAKYMHRATWAMIDCPIVESHPGSALLGAEAFRAHVAAYGMEDNRVAQIVYLAGLLLARHVSTRIPEASQIRDSLRKISESMRVVAAPNQIAVSRAGISLTILQRSEILLRRLAQAEDLAPAGSAVMEFLKRFGTPLFGSLFIQRVGRGFEDRRWMDWLRRDTRTQMLQRVGRGLLHRRFRMYAMYKKKIMKLRTILNKFVQRTGRGFLLRKEMYRVHLLRSVMEGALVRVRLCRRQCFLHKLQRIGRGYLGRLLIAAPYQEEVMRRTEMERQRRLQEERDRLSAAAERCRQRMLEVQRKLLEAAWDRVRVCMSDEARYREFLLLESYKEFQAIARASQKDLVHREEIQARRKDVFALEIRAREDEDKRLAALKKKPDLLQLRRKLLLASPIAPFVQQRSDSPLHFGRASPWESAAQRAESQSSYYKSPLATLDMEQQYQRRMIQRQYIDGMEVLLMWGLHCRIQLSRHAQRRKTSFLAELERRSAGAMYNDDSIIAEKQLMLERAAIRIQCAWRSNVARFERRYRILHRQTQRDHLYKKYVEDGDEGRLVLAPSLYETLRVAGRR